MEQNYNGDSPTNTREQGPSLPFGPFPSALIDEEQKVDASFSMVSHSVNSIYRAGTLPKGVRAMVYSYLTATELITTISKLSKYERAFV